MVFSIIKCVAHLIKQKLLRMEFVRVVDSPLIRMRNEMEIILNTFYVVVLVHMNCYAKCGISSACWNYTYCTWTHSHPHTHTHMDPKYSNHNNQLISSA